MPRANRYLLPGFCWHITHRCHDRKFLLKFKRDRRCYEHWLAEAKRRFSLSLLNYNLTSNHVHLLVYDQGEPEIIAQSMQLIAGCVAQQYNRRKIRSGAFWEGRYHATAVQSGNHLRRCMRYIDLNMVRTGKVSHPEQWETSGYHRIQKARLRENRIDIPMAIECLGFETFQQLQQWQCDTIAEALSEPLLREPQWTEPVAVGDASFLQKIAESLCLPDHKHAQTNGVLHEPGACYLLGSKNCKLTV